VPLDRRVWKEAVALRDAGWRVSVIGPRGDGDMRPLTETRDEIHLYRYPQRAASGVAGYIVEYIPSMLFTALWLLWVMGRHRVDVVHGCNPPDLFFVFGKLIRALGGAYVYDQHDVNPELSETKWGRRGLKGWLYRLTVALEGASYRTAGLVIVVNEAYAALARRRGGVSEDRLVVVPNAPDRAHFRALASGAPSPPGDVWRIGYLGVMGSQDGVDALIEAVAILARRRDGPVRVDLVGDGEAKPSLVRLAQERGVDATFHGYQSAESFVPLLAACHVVVSPDPPTPFNNVSTMTKVVDYLAIGKPIVSFALDETVRLAGNAAHVVTPATPDALADALDRLAGDPALLERLEAAARRRLDDLDLSWSRSAATLVAAYARLIDRVRAPASRAAP
jgi:glycosyltransferase involved in cell wall biosynthesis